MCVFVVFIQPGTRSWVYSVRIHHSRKQQTLLCVMKLWLISSGSLWTQVSSHTCTTHKGSMKTVITTIDCLLITVFISPISIQTTFVHFKSTFSSSYRTLTFRKCALVDIVLCPCYWQKKKEEKSCASSFYLSPMYHLRDYEFSTALQWTSLHWWLRD